MKKVLIIDEMHHSLVGMLQAIGLEPDYKPKITESEVLQIIDHYVGLVLRSKIFIGENVLNRAKNLRFIARAGAGMDKIVEEEVLKRNISLLNAPEGNRDAVAEHAVGMLLCMLNHMHTSDREVRSGLWLREENRGLELMYRTVGIIGYGNNGSAFAKRLKSFGCRIMVYDKYKKGYAEDDIEECTLEDLMEHCDVLSLHIPLSEDTHFMIHHGFIQKMKHPFYLINTSRGKVVRLHDLLDQLDKGQVLGACLDVLENENITDFRTRHPDLYLRLMNSKKVLLTPHVAGWTHESYRKINEVLVHKIKELGI